jgi:predicted O-linked N-acetylglucosamine transferase (SPINDLY family)
MQRTGISRLSFILSFCQRASLAILLRLGFDQFVSHSLQQYIVQAVTLASSIDDLDGLRLSIRDRLNASTLFRPDRYMIGFEKVLRTLWRNKCREHHGS